MKTIRILAFALAAAVPTLGFAADLPIEIRNEVMDACRSDYHRVCGDVIPGDGRVGRCLLDHERELTPSCLKASKIAYAVDVCSYDYRRYCEGVPLTGGRAFQCLSERANSLAPECERVVSANAQYSIFDRDRQNSRNPYAFYNAPPHQADNLNRDARRDDDDRHDERYVDDNTRHADVYRYEDRNDNIRESNSRDYRIHQRDVNDYAEHRTRDIDERYDDADPRDLK